jgi:hypothetical protein
VQAWFTKQVERIMPETYDTTHGRHVGKALNTPAGKMQNDKKTKMDADYPTVKQSTNHALCDCDVIFAML